jgi:hypothetical protein
VRAHAELIVVQHVGVAYDRLRTGVAGEYSFGANFKMVVRGREVSAVAEI